MIYIGEKRKRRERGSTYWSLGREKKEDSRKGDFFWKKTFSTLSVEEEIGKIFGGRLEGKYRERD